MSKGYIDGRNNLRFNWKMCLGILAMLGVIFFVALFYYSSKQKGVPLNSSEILSDEIPFKDNPNKKALEDEKLPDKYRDEIEERIRDTEESQREIGSKPQPGPGSESGEEPGTESGGEPENGQSEADADRNAEIL